jgi:hypothetical protein
VHTIQSVDSQGLATRLIRKHGTIRYHGKFGFLTTAGEPQDIEEALHDKNWKKALDTEFLALEKNEICHLVPPQKGRNIIDCKWVYKIKRKQDVSLGRYKARLVVKGF